ncbi:MAG TPA: alpha/beta hydrolase-fold protein [Aggregatilineales bacterium]|mgnify:CR=1 FL=1|nr:alpha/beta hydrolase-fold protein [Aggregatilineales bacterium]
MITLQTINSRWQAHPTMVRIAAPPTLNADTVITYVLPVEPADGTQYGNGFAQFVALGLHVQHNTIVAGPTFSAMPWYGDHPTVRTLQQARYFMEDVVPRVAAHYGRRKQLLLGFSKSGVGALSLLLRHPDQFFAAAVWDAPLMVETPDQWEMASVFGTSEQYARFRVKSLLAANAAALRQRRRIALHGYGIFRDHIRAAHDDLDALGVPHMFACDDYHEHRWDSGWLPACAAALVQLAGE